MKEYLFISGKLRFRSRVVMASIAISYVVMIVAVAVSSGFRKEIDEGLSKVSGDIQITPPNQNILDVSSPIERAPSYLSDIQGLGAVEDIVPVVYKAGIIKVKDNIHGVMVKGVPEWPEGVLCCPPGDSISLPVAVPRRLAEITGLGAGDKMLTYFVGEKTKVRQFNVVSVYDAILQQDDMLVVYSTISDLQRVDGWDENQVSSIEIHLKEDFKGEEEVESIAQEVSNIVYEYSQESASPVIANTTLSRFSQLYDWLDLIDFNVLFIIVLMVIVAGFNMISGLLIMLFENISTIGIFKAMGMSDASVSKVFLIKASSFLGKSMLIGNVIALAFCLLQDLTHFLKLNPENYFVGFVPVQLDITGILIADALSFVVIMSVLLLSVFFISKVNPADTVKMK